LILFRSNHTFVLYWFSVICAELDHAVPGREKYLLVRSGQVGKGLLFCS
jgi:hypothetical protein